MRLFGRRKAIAAGTVSPEDVFIASANGVAEPPDGVRGADDIHERNDRDVTDLNDEADAPGGPDTAPVPVVPAAPKNGSPDRVLRFGFKEDAAAAEVPTPGSPSSPASASGSSPASAGPRSPEPAALAPPQGLGAVVPVPRRDPGRPEDPVTAPTPAVGEGSVATKPRKIISIGSDLDLDEIETTSFDPSPVELARPGVEPRLRARRIQVLRSEGLRRLRWAVLGAVALLALAAAGIVLESPVFAINDVEVTGAAYTNRARLQGVVDDLDGATLLGADLHKAEATLAADPWVKRVRIERRPLRGVRIEIVERTPVATYMGTDQRWRVLDPTGRVLAVLDPPGSKPVDPLELKLPTPGPDLEPSATAPASLVAASDLVPRLPQSLRAQTCSMSVAATGGLQLNLCKHYVIDLGQPEQLRDKLIAAMYVMTARPTDVAASRRMNVSDPFHPVLISK
jgi:cell division protein FtsQ